MSEDRHAVLQALRERRSIPLVRPDPPPDELIEQVAAAAAWAPNHHHTTPWRLTVVSGDSRERLGEVMATSLRDRLSRAGVPVPDAAIVKERNKPLRAPVVIAVAAVTGDHPKAVAIEEIEATAAAVQNMLLAAQALGLGAMWRTGEPAYDPAVKEFLGFPTSATIVAFVYLGYPNLPELPDRGDRTLGDRLRWLR